MNEPSTSDLVDPPVGLQAEERHPLQTLSPPLGVVPPLTKAELIAAIDYETEQIENESKRPGWSNWALQGGIGALLWLALKDYGPSSDLKTIGMVFLFGSLMGEFILSACVYINNLGHQERKQLRYRFLKDNPTLAPPIVIFTLVRYSGLVLIYLMLHGSLHVPTLTWYCGAAIAACVVSLPLRKAKSLVLNKDQIYPKIHHSLSWLGIVWSGCLGYQLFVQLPFPETYYNTVDFRIGLLLVGVVYLLWLLASGEKERPIVNTLKGIRRELAFGRITVVEATQDTDIALSGLTTTAAIEHELTEISAKMKNVTLAYEKLVAECQATEIALKLLEEYGDVEESIWRDNARKVVLLIDSCEDNKITSQWMFNSTFFQLKLAMASISTLRNTDPVASPELSSKLQNTRNEMGKMCDLANSISPRLEGIKARYKAISFGNNHLNL